MNKLQTSYEDSVSTLAASRTTCHILQIDTQCHQMEQQPQYHSRLNAIDENTHHRRHDENIDTTVFCSANQYRQGQSNV
eukprot:2298079-Amphidinium_carterae.1